MRNAPKHLLFVSGKARTIKPVPNSQSWVLPQSLTSPGLNLRINSYTYPKVQWATWSKAQAAGVAVR